MVRCAFIAASVGGLLGVCFGAGGCGTAHAVASNSPFPNQIYGGVRCELNEPNVLTFYDIPFSAVADTLVLPYTIPRTLYNCAHPECRPRYDDWWDDPWVDHKSLAYGAGADCK